MSWRRPWHSDGPEVIGLREALTQMPIVARRGLEHIGGLASYPAVLLRQRNDRPVALPPPPMSDWVTAVDKLAGSRLTTPWFNHSKRTWQFATALLAAAEDNKDNEDLEPELVYVASMLHDIGLLADGRTQCFAVEGAQNAFSTAAEAGVPASMAKIVAEAISTHISVDPGNELGQYIQWGSLLDITGHRVWLIHRSVVSKACAAWSRGGFPAECRERWADECKLFPDGRAAFARFPGLLSAASYLAPLPRRGNHEGT